MNLGVAIRLNRTGFLLIVAATFILFVYISTGKIGSKTPSMKINLSDLLNVAIKAAENGGKEVVAVKDNLAIKNKGLTKEGLQDRVTTADLLSHCAITKTLNRAYPNLVIHSEETVAKCDPNQEVDLKAVKKSDLGDEWIDVKDVTVWIDPLDATYEYTAKLYDYVTTMVCVAVKGKPIIGVIHKPFSQKEKTFWAWDNKGISSNLKFEVNSNAELHEGGKLKIIVSMNHGGEIKQFLEEKVKDFELITAAGAGYKSLEVVTGRVDAYVHITAIKKWDICAGNAIINAQGGKMTTKTNELIDYTEETAVVNENGLVATMENHDQLIGKI